MSCFFRWAAACVACMALLIPVPALADIPTIIVTTPARTAQPIDRVGSKVIQLDAATLRSEGIVLVEDALQRVPSLLVSPSAGRGSQVQVRARGNEANHVLVLIDGIRVSNATTGEFDFSTLTMASIESIEVLLGPQSAIYGSDAIAGVILVTTRRGEEGAHGQVGAQVGELGTRSANATVSGASGGLHYAVNVEDFTTDGISAADADNGNPENDPFDKQSVNLRAGYEHSDFSTSVVIAQTDADYDFDGSDANGVPVDQVGNRQQTDESRIGWMIEWPAYRERLKNRLQVSRAMLDYATVSTVFGFASEYSAQTGRDALEYRGDYALNPDSNVQFGVERIAEQLETLSVGGFGSSAFDDEVSESAVYLNWLQRIGASDISIGARATDHQEYGAHATYRLTLSHRLSDDLRIRATHATGYKTPSLQELYDTTFGANSNLEPEQSVSSEVGVEFQLDEWQLALTYYDQDTEDLIRYVGVFPNARNENVGKASSHGIEFEAWRAWQRFDLSAGVTRTRASETQQGVRAQRIRVPEWAASVQGAYRFERGQVSLQMQYKDQRRDIQFSFPTRDVTLQSYTLFNLAMSYRPVQRLTISTRVDNLTDEDYAEVFGFGTRGRTALLAADWTF